MTPFLEPGEDVYWAGRPVYGKLWNEMSGEVVLGLIPFAFGVGFFTLALPLVRNDSLWILIAFSMFFGGIGTTMIAAPWRYRRMLGSTVYAVTSRRVLIVNGLQWGSRSAVQPRGIECEAFDHDQARLYQVTGRRRDILLGGVWKRGRRHRKYWVNAGFLATDDPMGAETAIRYLLALSSGMLSSDADSQE
ncbi:MAG: hypothetical protein R3C10_26145 [Pirellulales bacterium]